MPIASLTTSGARPAAWCGGRIGTLSPPMIASTSESMPASSSFLARRDGRPVPRRWSAPRAIGSGSFGEEDEPSKEAIERRK